MSPVFEPVPAAPRLQDLLAHFRAQEASMSEALHQLQAELELCHREAIYRQLDDEPHAETLARRCHDLQLECDALANDLVHVRMAIAGASEEMAQQRRPRLHLGAARARRRIGA